MSVGSFVLTLRFACTYLHEFRSASSPRLTQPTVSSQDVQEVTPGFEKVPSGHLSHVFVSVFRKVPPEQSVQETLPGAVLNSFNGQDWHSVEPALEENVLIEHLSHSEVDAAYVPAEHRAHVE